MVNYNCRRCGYQTTIKTILVRHLNRINKCRPVFEDICTEEYKIYILNCKKKNLKPNEPKMSQNEPKTLKNEPKMSQNEPKTLKNEPKMSQNELKTLKNEQNHECKFCKKKYKHIQSLNKHYKKCKEKDMDDKCKRDMIELVNKLNEQLDELNKRDKKRDKHDKKRDKQIDEQNKQINEQNKQINELIKKAGINIGTQNIQQNIKILAYKNTDLSHLTDKDYMFCLNRSNMCIPQLIKRIHFNPQKPENHNVYISNIKNKYVMIYDGYKWNLDNQDDTIEDLIDTNEFIFEQKLEEWLENGKDYPEIMKKFNRYKHSFSYCGLMRPSHVWRRRRQMMC